MNHTATSARHLARILFPLALAWGAHTAHAAVTYNVTDAAGLKDALTRVNPGDTIKLATGTYSGVFVIKRSGTKGNPINLTGPATAVLKNAGGYGLSVQADYWNLFGFTVSDSGKGVVLDGANHNLLDKLTVKNIDDEAIHLRAITANGTTRFSSNNVIRYNSISYTGRASGRAGYGEAIYLGSATNHWADRSAGKPDTSNYNCVYKNTLGPYVSAEGVDIKEGTVGGWVIGNTYDPTGISGENAADSFIDAKGNGYVIYGNTLGAAGLTSSVMLDGFQTHEKYTGFGDNNTFQKNTVYLSSSGKAVNIDSATSGNKVCSDNVANGGSGVSNVGTVSCPVISMPTCPDVLNN